MFVRKLVVIVVPLLLAALLCWVFPLLTELGFWTDMLMGALLGAALALLLPLSGATKRREPFAGLMWIPLMLLCIVVAGQYMAAIGIYVPVLDMFRTTQSQTVLVESAFIGYMAVQVIRTKK
ncbi:MAG: hypothetical protein E7327_02815 [Clostridiales bacterium]|nr:hypothetical protein [Clostridiales bacterium]